MPQTDAPARSRASGVVGRVRAVRARVRRTSTGRIAWRIAITVLGLGIVAVGVVLLPLPGPGWLIIFAGLGVLATEYEWASRLLHFARTTVSRWTDAMSRRSRPVQVLVGLAGLVLLVAIGAGVWWLTSRVGR